MSTVKLDERELRVIVRAIQKICDQTNVDFQDVFEEAALEVAGNYGDSSDAANLLSNLFVEN